MSATITEVVKEEVAWGRTGILEFQDDNIVFDTSDGEYGPVEIPISLFKQKLKEHEDKRS